ncbi:MAG: GNAT family N-acetyltransferase [Saprospiraceae bacterium]|nr:GNAT family N-acetyltransferase [Saprospiraceae bacterium]
MNIFLPSEINTENLILRPLQVEDAPSLFALDSDNRVMQYLGNQVLTDIAQVYQYLENIILQYEENGIGRWTVIENKSGKLIGWSGIKLIREETNGHEDFYDLGYRLRPQFWGLGYATESAKAWTKIADETLNIEFLYATANVENQGSQRVLKKSGFEITSSYDFILSGVPIPCVWMERKRK